MPENGFYFYATNPLTQSHPELGAWAISGSLKINRALSQEECDRILEKNGMKPQAWEQGKMNLQDLGYTGEQNDAARKTLAPITYDDSGNVIPLSERFNPEKHDIRYSISEEESKERAKGWLHSVGDKLAKGLHLKGEKIMLEEDAKDPSRDINLKQYIAASPSRVAEKVKTFRVLYVMADRAMNKVVSLRDGFERKLNKALALASSKDDRQDLFDLLLRGDAEGKEWTRQELIDDGVKENVADAYIQIRRQLNRAYHLVNDARRKPTPKSETVDKDRLAFLKANKFVTDLSVKDKGDGKYLVSYKEYKNYPKTYKEISADMVERFKNDPGIQVVDVKEAKTESGHAITDADGKPLYDVTTTEGPAELHKLKGYIPHFFHEYFLRVVDKDGNARTIGSARNQREAVMQAEAWMKDHKLADGETIHVQPKVFDINKALGVTDDDFAPVMGDKDFLRVQKNLAKQNDMTLAEAKDMLDGAVRLKGRHRFFGNALHRTGAAGFETDLDWALRHYFNSASRYVAMETEFKPKAISYFERVFGAFDKDYNNNLLAKYCKDYINDINGTPSSLEQAISKALNSTWLFKKVVIPTFGDRAALTLGNGIANKISYMTLGLNMSSALLNFSQLMNSAAYIGDVRSLGQMMKKGMHRDYSLHELRILKETGVLNDIGIDSQGVTSIDLSWPSGDVAIMPIDDAETNGDIRLLENRFDSDSADALLWGIEEGTLRVYADPGVSYIGETSLTLMIPASLMGTLGELSVEVLAGSVEVQNMKLDDLDVTIGSGFASIDGVTAHDLDLEVASGEAHVQGWFEEVDIDIMSGFAEVTVVDSSMLSELSLEVASGGLVVNLPESTGFTLIENATGSGEVRVSGFPITYSGQTAGTVGDGATVIETEVASGSIDIVSCPD